MLKIWFYQSIAEKDNNQIGLKKKSMSQEFSSLLVSGQGFWKTIWDFKMLLHSDPIMEFLKLYPKEKKNQREGPRCLYKNILYDVIYNGENQHHQNVQQQDNGKINDGTSIY